MRNTDDLIRVLQIGMHNEIGGVETYLMNYYRNIDKNKIQFDFINPYKTLCFEDEIRKLGGKIYNISNFKKYPFKYYKELKNIIKQNNYKIIHINMLSAANILPILAAKKCKVKHIIVHSHNSNTPSGLVRKFLNMINKKILLKNATDFFACSKLAGKWMYGSNIDFIVINNAIDLSKFKVNQNTRLEIRKELGIEEKFVIGHIGRFSYQKNHKFLIEVFNDLQKNIDKVVLLLIGKGELEEEIKRKVESLNLSSKIIFLGTTNKVNEYLQAMDIFVLPSRFEGLPVVGIEAQATNLKCLFSKNITKEAKVIDTTEYLPITNYKIWSEYIEKYIKDNNKKNSELFPKEYDIFVAVKRLENLYQKLYQNL